MQRFVDEAVIEVASGSGGAGCVSFRREKYVPRGGPDGGDGGRGGDLIFQIKRNVKTLFHLKQQINFRAENGRPGEGRKKHGRDGVDCIIPVPPGTIIRDADSGKIIQDLAEIEDSWLFLSGGKGGKGNTHFKSSIKQAPRYAQPGLPGEERTIRVELNIIADIGLVGFPNAGKSTLLSVITNAHPKIGAYPFTTKIPNLGVLDAWGSDIIVADIPGIIEGAAEGAGLGLRFLKHISRTVGLAFLIDLSDKNYLDAFPTLLDELEEYGHQLSSKKRILVGTKTDLTSFISVEDDDHPLKQLKKKFPHETIIGISSVAADGLDQLKQEFTKLYKQE